MEVFNRSLSESEGSGVNDGTQILKAKDWLIKQSFQC